MVIARHPGFPVPLTRNLLVDSGFPLGGSSRVGLWGIGGRVLEDLTTEDIL